MVSIAAVTTHLYEQAAQTEPWPATSEKEEEDAIDTESLASSSAASPSAKQQSQQHRTSAGGPVAASHAASPQRPSRPLSAEETETVLQSDDFAVFVRNASLAVRSALDAPRSGADSLLSLLRGDADAAASGDSGSAPMHAVAYVPAAASQTGLSATGGRKVPAPAGCALRGLVPCPHDGTSFIAVWTPTPSSSSSSSALGSRDAWCVGDAPPGQAAGADSHLEVWSLGDLAAPQALLSLPSGAVTCVVWHPFIPHCVLAGTAAGQLASWDVRGVTAAPASLSALGGGSGQVQGHVHPVTGIVVPGTQNTHSIVSVSLDGRLCVWSDSTLSAPSSASMLSGPRSVMLATEAAAAMDIDGLAAASGRVPPPCATRSVPLAAVSLSAVPTDPSSMLVGTQDGGVFRVALSPQGDASVAASLASAGDGFGAQAGFSLASSFWAEAAEMAARGGQAIPAGHDGPVTGLVHHPGFQENPLLGDVFASGGADWTLRVWSPRLTQSPLVSIHGPSSAVHSVAWCPRMSHPGLVSACHADGSVRVWDVSFAAKHGIAAHSVAHFQIPQGTAATHALWLQGSMNGSPPLLVADALGGFRVLECSAALAKGSTGGASALLDTLLALAPK